MIFKELEFVNNKNDSNNDTKTKNDKQRTVGRKS